MTSFKEITGAAMLGFCPTGPILAKGSAAASSEGHAEGLSTLQLHHLRFQDEGSSLAQAGGTITAASRFCRLAWSSAAGEGQEAGALAGSQWDGSIALWSPSQVLKATAGAAAPASCQLVRLPKDAAATTAAARGLDFNRNPSSMHLLASSGPDGELHIWDCAVPSRPKLYPILKAGPSGAAAAKAEIMHLGWNRMVPHIVASCNAAGITTIWDLKKNKPVISLKDQSGRVRRASALQWHPTVGTKLAVACDDEAAPVVQVWDLRSTAAPLQELADHTKGVLSLSWSPHDTSMLLSSGKDGKAFLWDMASGQALGNATISESWAHDIAWAPTIPGVFAVSSCGQEGTPGKVDICTTATFTSPETSESFNEDFTLQQVSSGPKPPLAKAPAWLKRPAGATFGFGGQLVAFQNHRHQQAVGEASHQGVVRLAQMTPPEEGSGLAAQAEAFNQNVLQQQERPVWAEYCQHKAGTATKGTDKETWTWLHLLFQEDASRKLLGMLGFEDVLPPVPKDASAGVDAAAQQLEASALANGPTTSPPQEDANGFFEQDPADSSSFFDDLASQIPQSPTAKGTSPAPSPRGPAPGGLHHDEAEAQPGTAESSILRALCAANYSAAVDACLQADRITDALLIAASGGSELFQRAQDELMKRQPRPYMQVIKAVVKSDILGLVKRRALDKWRETLAIIISHAASSNEEMASLADALARRLSTAGMVHPATLCWICAGSVDKAVEYWSRESQGPGFTIDTLQELLEQGLLLACAIQLPTDGGALGNLLATYSAVLAGQGHLRMALDFSELMVAEPATALAAIRDRLFNCGAGGMPAQPVGLPAPFEPVDVQPQPDAADVDAASAATPQPGAAALAATNSGQGYGTEAYAQSGYQTSYGQHAAYQNQFQSHSSYNSQASQYQQPAAAPPSQPKHAYASQYTAAPTDSGYGSVYGSQQPTSQWGAGSYGANTGQQVGRPAAAAQTFAPPQQQWGPAARQPAAPPPSQPSPAPAASSFAQPSTFMPQFTSRSTPAAQTTSTPPTLAALQTKAISGPTSNGVKAPAAPQAPGMFMPQQQMSVPQTPTSARSPQAAGFGQFGTAPASMAPAPVAPPPAPAAPPQPKGPPSNISITSADTSKVEPGMKVVVQSLTQLFTDCASVSQAPGKRREMDKASQVLGALFWSLNEGELSEGVKPKLQQLGAALARQDWDMALQIQMGLTSTDWDECKSWLSVLKRLIKQRQTTS
ncbi:hypothetical protein WJX74_001433 [Apatococcus lobatus]|uniref:Ancestral coatomer element 1 Sec16/Sec31 domain-containing protein n=1 Tax=Apatococcus lobatus TaxID=904363 RepID=A0AAW1RRT5_9CHLO